MYPYVHSSTVYNSQDMLLLLLLSRFSHVRLCATPQMAAHQAPPSPGFSRQEHWSGLLFPSPMHESEVTQSCPTLSDPMDCSLPGSSIHGIFQARVLEWAFSLLCINLVSLLPVSPYFPHCSQSYLPKTQHVPVTSVLITMKETVSNKTAFHAKAYP